MQQSDDVDPAREFWERMLEGAGYTAIPRWTTDPQSGTGAHERVIPQSELAGLLALADAQGVPLESTLLAAHARVLATLAGEQDVVTGYANPSGRAPVPCRLTTSPGTWRELVTATGRLEMELQWQLEQGGEAPVDSVSGGLGLSGPLFETVVDASGAGSALPASAVLQLSMERDGTGLRLRLVHRTEVLDAAAAARILGYHVTALAHMALDPDSSHGQACLLSAEELRYQVHDLVGPDRAVPDQRVHELFEQRVLAHPDAVAAVHGTEQWTYRQLNARANRLARALLSRGLHREVVVTVVMERNLDWMAAVLGIWKAGLTYLPLEPHFPPGRMLTAISKAESPLVMTAAGSSASLHEALEGLPDVQEVLVPDLLAEGHSESNLDVAVAPDQLAYILFTSGSTGDPKGVMCEHAGMLNHIYAKLDDLGVREGEAVPQTGPQCFDISVWQLVGALMVGGRTLFVDQDAILDVERFVDAIVDGRAGVIQVVPSYLDVIVSYLEEHPRELPDLHCVCPTGDFLKKELVERWFRLHPHIPVVNTYGLTETSDDAVHEIMNRPPDGPRVPLGRPIINTHVDVVDEWGNPVPLGAPGVIVFSGVCVGRGYVNDPERTAAMFGPDPHRDGSRICRTGDYGRWQPNGKLDFLGRRDNQVKIRGFRIEIGEIENALLRVPGVRDGAVVVATSADQTESLVAFWAGDGALEVETIRSALARRVPDYMVPSAYHWQASLPLTGNGKIDRRVLAGIAKEVVRAGRAGAPPRTASELRLAAAWSTVLGVPQDRISTADSFFELGGTSLSAVKLAVLMDRAVSIKDVLRAPVLRDLAALLEAASPEVRAGPPEAPAGQTAAALLPRHRTPGNTACPPRTDSTA